MRGGPTCMDVPMVTRVDRLARSIGDLQDIVRTLKTKGASLRATEQPIDTSTAAGKCFLDMLGVFAEFETNLRRERQLEGIDTSQRFHATFLRWTKRTRLSRTLPARSWRAGSA
jgi:DNA invertase Pin-like site-specific DNA recombinase